MTTPNENFQTWESVAERMPELLKELRCSDLLRRDSPAWSPRDLPKKGVYVFYGHHKIRGPDKPIYVGRTNGMHGRILEHAYPSSSHNSATFAFLLAVETAQEKGIDCETPKRDELHNTPAFRPLFKVAKKRVRGMEFRVVEINDAIEQAVFEVYAAMELGTTLEQGGYNDFDNH